MRDARGFEPVQMREPPEEELGSPMRSRRTVPGTTSITRTRSTRRPSARPRVNSSSTTRRRAILERSLEELRRALPDGARIAVYKNNSDGKGNSYGTHENYLVDRATPFAATSAT